MLDLSRREILFGSTAATLLSSLAPSPLFAQAAAGGSPGAAWDLRDLYPSDAAWEAERQSIMAAIPSLRSFQGKLGSSAATLKAAAQAQSDLNLRTLAPLQLCPAQGGRGPADRC